MPVSCPYGHQGIEDFINTRKSVQSVRGGSGGLLIVDKILNRQFEMKIKIQMMVVLGWARSKHEDGWTL